MSGHRIGFWVLFACAACNGKEAQSPTNDAPTAAPSASVAPAASDSAAALAAASANASPLVLAPQADKFPKTPEQLNVPLNSTLVLKARGKGVQIYECVAKADKKAFEWKLKAPEADLFNDKGEKVAHHSAGPSWQAPDGSSVLGSVTGKADAPDGQSIPWLLLTSVGKGPGALANVMHVQRLDTSGGKAPEAGCDAAHAKSKTESRVPYEATYYFYSLPPAAK
ncbi:MAG TPA: DUF3455 domain-containing protein [Polyangiaceae bacterium]|jgi:hypothetical protein